MTAQTQAPQWSGDAEGFVDALIRWLTEAGTTRYDESVTQIEHALQSAARAVENDADDDGVVAALLHDVGHILIGEHRGREDFLQNDGRHEAVGAHWLTHAFSARVTQPIELHVPAKRYLCAIEPAYWDGLSMASKASLRIQGGPMNEAEAQAFAALPGAKMAVALRRWDDQAKVSGATVPALENYRARLITLAGSDE